MWLEYSQLCSFLIINELSWERKGKKKKSLLRNTIVTTRWKIKKDKNKVICLGVISQHAAGCLQMNRVRQEPDSISMLAKIESNKYKPHKQTGWFSLVRNTVTNFEVQKKHKLNNVQLYRSYSKSIFLLLHGIILFHFLTAVCFHHPFPSLSWLAASSHLSDFFQFNISELPYD